MRRRRLLEMAAGAGLWLLAGVCGRGALAGPGAGQAARGRQPEGSSGAAGPRAEPARFGWPEAPLGEGAIARTLGVRADHDQGSEPTEVVPEVGDRDGAHAWRGPQGYERPGDPEGFWPYARASQLPDGGRGFLGWRAIIPGYPADVLIPGDSTHFAIEYKDNLLSPRLDPYWPKGDGVSVRIGEVILGELPATRDHRWKRAVFAIPSGAPKTRSGRYRVRLGGGTYGRNEFYGSMLVHRLIAARGPIPARPPVDGFWPTTVPVMADGRLYDRAGRPYVPIIVNIPAGNNDADQIEAVTLIGANTNIASGFAEGNARRGWAHGEWRWADRSGRPQVQRGVAATMAESVRRGLFTVPMVFTDLNQYYVTHVGRSIRFGGKPYERLYDGTWRGVVRVWEAALRDLVAESRHVPFVYLKDEWDHEDQWWGSLEEQVVELRALANRVAPGVPTMVTTQGWKPLMHRAAFDLADFQATDRYPKPERLAEVAMWAEHVRRHAAGRAFLNVLAFSRAYGPRPAPKAWHDLTYMRAGVYMSLVHGARGAWLWGDPAGMNGDARLGYAARDAADYYRSFKPLTDELRELADVIHGSAEELGRTIATTRLTPAAYPLRYQAIGDGTSETDGVATAYRRAAGGRRKVLLAVNEWLEPRRARLRVAGVRAGDRIPVLFEGREVAAERDGAFEDGFEPHARHVYLIPR